jgi:hypothetical protein
MYRQEVVDGLDLLQVDRYGYFLDIPSDQNLVAWEGLTENLRNEILSLAGEYNDYVVAPRYGADNGERFYNLDELLRARQG